MAIDCSWFTRLVKPINRLLNKNGQAYSLTVLTPIKNREVDSLRSYLSSLPIADSESPFARISLIHNIRFNIIDDLPFVGAPALEDHIIGQYLLCSCNFDTGNTKFGSITKDLENFLQHLFTSIPNEISAIWGHCVGFPDSLTLHSFGDFIKLHQLHGGFFFSDYPENTTTDALRSLFEQKQFINFVIKAQTLSANDPLQLKDNFYQFFKALEEMPTPPPGTIL